MDIDMGKSQETEYYLANQERRNAKRNSSKESMTDSYKIKNSVFEWLKIIEMKFVDEGVLLRMKITLTNWQNKNTSTTRTNGGFIPNKQGSNTVPLRQSSDFKLALSTLQRLQQEAGEEPHAPVRQAMADGTEFIFNMVELARLLVVFLLFRKSRRKSQILSEQRDPLLIVLGENLRKWLSQNSIYFVTDGSFTADGGLL